ncbi:acidic fibroblast growth factor binding protein [Basidiobolus meristosporus CBS 931.73]|uniref:Acidic fibroblast growth factor binding protein n=1 Tax=Basidiobolus meristosporus CBS 931.73 TaxID=1314790 RepID=A0A1Y1XTU8_9FUNG|nr:acidic fibroblast growth factor binding protein [Basidiobolus meristosporus CBS 931.73]|eukprot:ORX88926.1 acidic fibroblast growth factor binding protein [Basidiobolus meristosporus CBS 931.73]
MTEFTIFLENEFEVDKSIYEQWLMGFTVEQTFERRKALVSQGVSPKTVYNYVLSHYRTFEKFEHYLHRPRYFIGQFLFPLPMEVKQELVEKYYGFDEAVMRELLGKKLSSRLRKDLEDISVKTKLPLGACRRQFDNLKRILKQVEESEGQRIIEDIEQKFLLPHPLARLYAHIIFLSNNRFDTSRRKLSYYNFADFEFCASVLSHYWTPTSLTNLEELDENLALDIRDLKLVVARDKGHVEEYRVAVFNHLKSHTSLNPTEKLANQFKLLYRNVLNVGCDLGNAKETKDIFLNLVEKFIEPCALVGLSAADMDHLFSSMIVCFEQLSFFEPISKKRYVTAMTRLLTGIKLMTTRLYRVPKFSPLTRMRAS